MASLLEQLSEMTVVVADTGDLEAIKKFTPRDATTNPSLILAAAQIPAYQSLIDEALRSSRKLIGENAPVEEVVREALDEISVIFGKDESVSVLFRWWLPCRNSNGHPLPSTHGEEQS